VGRAEVHTSKSHFLVKMDVRHFCPEELMVKTLEGFLIIDGEHEDKVDGVGSASRSFSRHFVLPVNCNVDGLHCEILPGGTLKVVIPREIPEGKGTYHCVKQGHHCIPHDIGGGGDAAVHPSGGGDDYRRLVSGLSCNEKHFVVKLELQHYTPEEILVKNEDDWLIIQGNHKEKTDEHGKISRSFKRRYILPVNADKENVTCEINQEGMLTVTVPRIIAEKLGHEKSFQINRV